MKIPMIPMILFHLPPVRALKAPPDQPIEMIRIRVDDQEADDDTGGEDRPICCINCRQPVTSARNRIHVNGSHRHIFNNPSGYIFEIGCFSGADGCAHRGHPTMEFTWFAGFAWRYAMCGKCHIHLGWRYESGGSVFFGLILDRLVEESKGKQS